MNGNIQEQTKVQKTIQLSLLRKITKLTEDTIEEKQILKK